MQQSTTLIVKRHGHASLSINGFDDERVCFIQFEDMVYKYDDITKKIANWLGLELKAQTKKS